MNEDNKGFFVLLFYKCFVCSKNKREKCFLMSSFSDFQQNKIGQDKLVFFPGLGIYGRRGSDPAPCINHKRGLRNDWQASLGIRNIRSQESGSWGEGCLST